MRPVTNPVHVTHKYKKYNVIWKGILKYSETLMIYDNVTPQPEIMDLTQRSAGIGTPAIIR